MKQNKDGQIRELKEDRDFYETYFDSWGYWVIGCFVLMVIILVVGLVSFSTINDLKQDLFECQDKVPTNETYRLEVECYLEFYQRPIIINQTFQTKEIYEMALKDYSKDKTCEVISE